MAGGPLGEALREAFRLKQVLWGSANLDSSLPSAAMTTQCPLEPSRPIRALKPNLPPGQTQQPEKERRQQDQRQQEQRQPEPRATDCCPDH